MGDLSTFGALLNNAGSRMMYAGFVILHLDGFYPNMTEYCCFCSVSEQSKLRS